MVEREKQSKRNSGSGNSRFIALELIEERLFQSVENTSVDGFFNEDKFIQNAKNLIKEYKYFCPLNIVKRKYGNVRKFIDCYNIKNNACVQIPSKRNLNAKNS